jgi:hypothetical protein
VWLQNKMTDFKVRCEEKRDKITLMIAWKYLIGALKLKNRKLLILVSACCWALLKMSYVFFEMNGEGDRGCFILVSE